MKKSLLITFLVLAMATIIGFTVFALTEKDTPNNDETLADETVSNVVEEAEKILDLTEYAKSLNYTEINDETLSEIAKLTLNLFEEYDKIFVECSWYTSFFVTFNFSETSITRQSVKTTSKVIGQRDGVDVYSIEYGPEKIVVDCKKGTRAGNSLVFLGIMLEVFSDDFYFGDEIGLKYIATINREVGYALVFTTNYKKLGFETIDEYKNATYTLSDDIIDIANEMSKYENKETPLTEKEAQTLQELTEKKEKLDELKKNIYNDVYRIDFKRFSLDKAGQDIYVVGKGCVDTTIWTSVADIAKIK